MDYSRNFIWIKLSNAFYFIIIFFFNKKEQQKIIHR